MTPACRMFGSGTVCATPRVTTRASPVPERRRTTMRVLAIALIIGLLLAVPGSAQQPSEKLGTVNFPTSCNSAAQTEFSRAVALLHSFWFSYAIKGFEATVQTDPSCGIAYWGAAVARLGNPLAGAPPAKDVELGAATVAKGKSVGAKTQRELDYLAAIETFYKDYDKVDHRTRAQNYEKAMEALAARYPQDREAAIFYALALNVTLNPNDKTYANQLKAAAILEKVFAEQPNHPGVAHYLIHSYDFPPIANKGLDAARLHPKSLSWQKFPQAESILWFARGLGAARGGNVASAKVDLARIEALRDSMTAAKNTYWAGQAEIQRLAVASWIARAEGRNDEALALLRQAADAESATEKHPVTPGAIQPAREMLGELLLEVNQPAKALAEFEASQRTDPNRFHGLPGAGRAAELAGDRERARKYYGELLARARTADSERPELKQAKAFLAE